MGGSQYAQTKPTDAQGEHADATQKDRRQDSNPNLLAGRDSANHHSTMPPHENHQKKKNGQPRTTVIQRHKNTGGNNPQSGNVFTHTNRKLKIRQRTERDQA